MPTPPQAFAERRVLRELADRPGEQAALARGLVARTPSPQVLRAALDVMATAPPDELHETLVQRYQVLDADPIHRDAGGYLRALLLDALRPVALPSDLPLLERAVTTYEVLPTSPEDVTGPLRAAALVILAAQDDLLAGYHAVRLLFDMRTAAMSGEPAATAARVLAALGHPLPLYGFVMRGADAMEPSRREREAERMREAGRMRYGAAPGGRGSDAPEESTRGRRGDTAGGANANPGMGETAAECLRNLTDLPDTLLAAVVGHWLPSGNEVVLVGLVDLLLNHRGGEAYGPRLGQFLATTPLVDLYRYAVMATIAARRPAFLGMLLSLVDQPLDAEKRAILAEGLSILAGTSEIDRALKRLEPTIQTQRRQS